MNAEIDKPAVECLDLSEVLAALADPGRLATVALLAGAGPQTCKYIPELIGVDWGKSTLSHHLRVLREAGITHTHVLGSRREVSLRWADLERRFPGLLTAVLAGIPTTTPSPS